MITFSDPFSTDEANRLAEYRAAELTNQHGFDYFILNKSRVDESTATKIIRMYKGAAPSGNPLAYNAKAILKVMPQTIERSN
ncbi:MAG: hypothetical protein Q8902_12795 [Bacteroidota bacterium]|nr:hypothetical protein [Bacteroidota bacterium]MDP4233989.1 hypothetical protein [Bacteroidota bacterium]MDP4242856.1 hypothetical protein [Bacteroidota bacterium]